MVTVYIAARDIGNYKDNTERLKEVLIERFQRGYYTF